MRVSRKKKRSSKKPSSREKFSAPSQSGGEKAFFLFDKEKRIELM
jgi:hypothetical protein